MSTYLFYSLISLTNAQALFILQLDTVVFQVSKNIIIF